MRPDPRGLACQVCGRRATSRVERFSRGRLVGTWVCCREHVDQGVAFADGPGSAVVIVVNTEVNEGDGPPPPRQSRVVTPEGAVVYGASRPTGDRAL